MQALSYQLGIQSDASKTDMNIRSSDVNITTEAPKQMWHINKLLLRHALQTVLHSHFQWDND